MVNVRKLLENSNIRAELPGLDSRIKYDEPMAGHTTFKIGGPADCFAEPENARECAALIELCSSTGIPVSVLGGGSNLLVADRGIRGLVLSLSRMSSIERIVACSSPEDRDRVFVRSGSGTSMEALVAWCAERGISGLERFAGLPGSVGGATFMNARCYDRAVSDVFYCAEALYLRDGRCTIEETAYNGADWDYKKSPFQVRNGADQARIGENAVILLSVTCRLISGDSESILAEMATYVKDRDCKGHFRFPSAGSMFKNNHAFGKPSGKIIDEAGLCGFRVGDAQVAPWHGNIVINTGHATALEVRTLVDEVCARVLERTGFALEPEVIMAGDWDR